MIAELATAAHGLVTRDGLRRAGVTQAEIAARVRAGALLREYPGVYRVGHRAPSLDARYLAAVWACGDDALLFGGSAGHHLSLLRDGPMVPEVLTAGHRRVAGVRIVRARRTGIDDADRAVHRGVPVTSPARTLVDLAGTLLLAALARACHEAGVRYGTTPGAIATVLARRPNAPGSKKLRSVITGDAPVTLSVLERRFLERLDAAGLPRPQVNRRVGRSYVDCRWPAHRLTVELDSYRYHHSRHAWEQDHRRERAARARGDEHRRYTWTDVVEQPAAMLRELRELLGGEAYNARASSEAVPKRVGAGPIRTKPWRS